ncbi:MAG TPA: hypothetical protein VFV75_12615 [Candidatus Polarisedimenticolaceae bacterium]|nr:hypothetical protein [Candidatus Polarisedimenticolaceae bacterium]
MGLGIANAVLQCVLWLSVTHLAFSSGIGRASNEGEAYAWLFGGVFFWPLLWFVVTFVWALLARFLLEVEHWKVLVGLPVSVASALTAILLVIAI